MSDKVREGKRSSRRKRERDRLSFWCPGSFRSRIPVLHIPIRSVHCPDASLSRPPAHPPILTEYLPGFSCTRCGGGGGGGGRGGCCRPPPASSCGCGPPGAYCAAMYGIGAFDGYCCSGACWTGDGAGSSGMTSPFPPRTHFGLGLCSIAGRCGRSDVVVGA